MKVWAYCTERNARSVQAAVGVEPLTSPPLTGETVTKSMLEGHDFMYFRLHGLKETPSIWYGGDEVRGFVAALTPDNLDDVSLDGAVVVLANCYGVSSYIVPVMIRAGAGAVIAGPGENYAAKSGRVVGADLLAQKILWGLNRGWGPTRALRFARSRLLLSSWRSADRDALAFTIRGI